MINVFLLLKGCLVGLVFSATTVAATVWCVQLGRVRGGAAARTAAIALTVGQGLWALLGAGTMWLLSFLPSYVAGARGLSALVFIYMAIKSARTPPVQELPQLTAKLTQGKLALATLAVLLSMPMRFFGTVGLLLVAGVMRPRLHPWSVAELVTGVMAGTAVWFGLVGMLADRWRDSLPEARWVVAIRRQTRLATLMYAGLAIIVAAPALLFWIRSTR